MTELQQLRAENAILHCCVLSVDNLKHDAKMFQFYTNLPNYEVFAALCGYLHHRTDKKAREMKRWKSGKGQPTELYEHPRAQGWCNK